jgi:hypothetical protein
MEAIPSLSQRWIDTLTGDPVLPNSDLVSELRKNGLKVEGVEKEVKGIYPLFVKKLCHALVRDVLRGLEIYSYHNDWSREDARIS